MVTQKCNSIQSSTETAEAAAEVNLQCIRIHNINTYKLLHKVY